MPDISMCAAKCPVSKKCYRHPDSGTEPSGWQLWAGLGPTDEWGCEYFIQRLETPTND